MLFDTIMWRGRRDQIDRVQLRNSLRETAAWPLLEQA